MSPSADGERRLRRFFLITFSLRLHFAKKKRLWSLCKQTSCLLTKICQPLFSFDEIGAKERKQGYALLRRIGFANAQKRKAPQMGGAAPPPRKLLEKLDQNLLTVTLKLLTMQDGDFFTVLCISTYIRSNPKKESIYEIPYPKSQARIDFPLL